MHHPGILLILVGLLLAAVGLAWVLLPHVPWLGRLPGDIVIERDSFRFYFPVATCVLLSAVVSFVLWLIKSLFR
jgi:uncharacterized protein HemY